MFFKYLLEASLVLPFKANRFELSGHNTLAMTNSQTLGPFCWICWSFVRLSVGDALKFIKFKITTLEPDWCAFGQPVSNRRYATGEIVQFLRNGESVNYIASAW